MRDPWSRNPYNTSGSTWADHWNRILESKVLKHADVILCTTDAACDVMREQFPMLPRDRILSVPNGYDAEDLEAVTPKPAWSLQDRPVYLHAGSIYGKRDPSSFLDALGMYHDENPQRCPHVVFLGVWEPPLKHRAEAIIEQRRLKSVVELPGEVPRERALAAQAAADGLVLLGDSLPQKLQVPAKLFEYLWLDKPILSLFPAGAPADKFLNNYATTFASASPDNPQEILGALRELCSDPKTQRRNVRPMQELSRAHQIAVVNEVMEALLSETEIRL